MNEISTWIFEAEAMIPPRFLSVVRGLHDIGSRFVQSYDKMMTGRRFLHYIYKLKVTYGSVVGFEST